MTLPYHTTHNAKDVFSQAHDANRQQTSPNAENARNTDVIQGKTDSLFPQQFKLKSSSVDAENTEWLFFTRQ
jgi:hypothetical protein